MVYLNKLIISSAILLLIIKINKCSDELNCSTIETTLEKETDACPSHYFLLKDNSREWNDFSLKFYAKVEAGGVLVHLFETPNDVSDKYVITLDRIVKIKKGTSLKKQSYIWNILSPIEPRLFWVNISRSGNVSVGTSRSVLLSYTDDNPFHVKYYSFCPKSFHLTAKFYFNCAEGKNEETKFQLTPEEKLRRDIIDTLDSVSEPVINEWDKTLPITITPKIWRISLNEQISKFSMYGTATLDWFDDRLIWEVEKYNRTYEIFMEHSQSWKPQIVLFNPFRSKDSKPFMRGPIKTTSEGYVTWLTKLEIHSACAVDFQNWPWDIHVCKVRLGTWSRNDILIYSQVEDMKPARSEWIILDYHVVNNVSVMENIPDSLNHTVVEIQYILKRKTSFYHKLFYYMFITGSTLLLLSMCSNSLGVTRIFLNGFYILLMTIFLLVTTNSLPEVAEATPITVMGYNFMLVLSLAYCSISIFLIGMTRMEHKSPPPDRISLILDNPLLCKILFLPQQPAGTTDITNDIENVKKKTDFSEKWVKLSIAVDRLLLISAILFTFFLIPPFSTDDKSIKN